MSLNALDLFSGMGGAALALEKTKLFRTVAYCDNNAQSQMLLTALMEEGLIHNAPIHDDVKKLKSKDLPKIDMISAGFPCQDVSSAGKRSRIEGGVRTRLVFEVIRLSKELKPSYVFLENVSAIISDPKYLTVIEALRKQGYDIATGVFDAASQGAQHLRMRWFLLARLPGSKKLKIPTKNPLRRYVKTVYPTDLVKDGKVSATLCKFIGNAVMPACAFEALQKLNASMDSEAIKSNISKEDICHRHVFRWLKNMRTADMISQYSPGKCKGGPFLLKKPDYTKFTKTSKVTSNLIDDDVYVPCLPTPRTGTNTVRHAFPTSRSLRDLGVAIPALDGYKQLGIIDHKSLLGLMGFPQKWLAALHKIGIA